MLFKGKNKKGSLNIEDYQPDGWEDDAADESGAVATAHTASPVKPDVSSSSFGYGDGVHLCRPPVTGKIPYIRGTLPAAQFYRAARLGGKALAVYLILWHEAGLNQDVRVVHLSTKTNKWMRAANVSPDAKRRALIALMGAGLVYYKPSPNSSPDITILYDGEVVEDNSLGDTGENEST